jgi:hypothetical protein
LNSFQLKLLALFAMAVDHTGAVLFPSEPLFRIIGRVSFPIYCFLLAEGFYYTSSRWRYVKRLLLWGTVSEIPYDLAFHNAWIDLRYQNVFWTLLLGFCAMWCLEKFRQRPLEASLLVMGLSVAAELLLTDYGGFGVLLIVIFYVFRDYRSKSQGMFLLCNAGYALLFNSPTQLFASVAGMPIGFYSGKRGRKLPRFLFYGFYPVHLLCLAAIQYAVII